MGNDEMSEIFNEWNQGELDSFLIEISTAILKYKDDKGEFLLEKIRDAAGQKGTGKWTAISALEYGMPVTLIGESVFARSAYCLASKDTICGGFVQVCHNHLVGACQA